jgi:hypothetical protein
MLVVDQNTDVWQVGVLAFIEHAINAAIKKHPDALYWLEPYIGSVIRVKTEAPHYVVFIVLSKTGVQLYHQFDGGVDVRACVPAKILLGFFLGLETRLELLNHFEVLGDRLIFDQFFFLLEQIHIESFVQGFLSHLFGQNILGEKKKQEIMRRLLADDLSWMHQMQALPQWFQQWSQEQKNLRETQQMLAETLAEMKLLLGVQKKERARLRILGGFLLFAAVLFGVSEFAHWQMPITHSTLLLFSIGGILCIWS